MKKAAFGIISFWGFAAVLVVIGFFLVLKSERTDESQPQPTPSPIVTPTPYKDLNILDSPLEGGRINSPLTISGRARGNWYFEATFPVVLTNWDGLVIAEGYATAQDEWMTTDYVPFTAELVFVKPEYGERGTLILQRSNPSGLPEYDDALEITVYFE